MGYQTEFNFSIKDDVNGAILEDNSLSKRLDAYADSLGANDCLDYLKELLRDGYINGKWYEHEEDMKELSLKFQDVVFQLDGKGEEDDDRWIKYFLNGKMQECFASILIKYPDFDLKKFK